MPMAEQMIEELIDKLKQVATLYYRLVLLIGPADSGKTACLVEVMRRQQLPLVNVSLELSRSLLPLTERQRAFQLTRILEEIILAAGSPVVSLDNIELLFAPALKQDPLRVLQSLARSHTLVAAWQGTVQAAGFVVADVRTLDKQQGSYPPSHQHRRQAEFGHLRLSAERRFGGTIQARSWHRAGRVGFRLYAPQAFARVRFQGGSSRDHRRTAKLPVLRSHGRFPRPARSPGSRIGRRILQKHQKPLELSAILAENFLVCDGKGEVPGQIHSHLSTNFKDLRNRPKDDPELRAKNRWYVPDPNKAADLEKLRERALLKEFWEYLPPGYKPAEEDPPHAVLPGFEDRQAKTLRGRRLKVIRLEAVRAGFKHCWQNRDYSTIIAVAQRIPENVLQEAPKLLMWYDQALTRTENEQPRRCASMTHDEEDNQAAAEREVPYDVIRDEEELELTPDGTEYEDTGIAKPFSPSLINIQIRQLSLDTLMKRVREGRLDLFPDFQRSVVWKQAARSRLIESLLIRIPLPAFYMDATDEDHWVVVDGQQRLSALMDFASNAMRLRNLEFLTQFHGFTYSELPRNFQRRIEESVVTVYLIEKGTPPEVKFSVFKRINTVSLPLSPQEFRHALNQGPVTSYLKLLADSEEFQRATHGSVGDHRMAARECVLRFFAFTLTPPEDYQAADFDAFLSEAMASINRMAESERCRLAERFKRALIWSHKIFGDTAFRKPSRRKRNPVNKALFEVWTVTMDSQTDDTLKRLYSFRENLRPQLSDAIRADGRFLESISQGTGDVAKVRLRFARFREIIEKALP